jgi:YggT family protein
MGYIGGFSCLGHRSGLALAGTGVNRNAAAKLCLAQRGCLPYLSTEQPEGNGMGTLYEALMLILDVVWFVMIAHIIMSWLINFQVLNLRQPLIWQVWNGLNRLLEPIYGPVRSILPNTGGLDLAPLVVFIGIIILQRALANNAAWFYGF